MLTTILLLLAACAIGFTQSNECPSAPGITWIPYGGTNKCFQFLDRRLTEKEAKRECEEQGAQLVSICSFFENQFVRGITRGRDTWISTKTSCPYTNFLDGSTPTALKACRVITEDWNGGWRVASCDEEKHFAVCEQPIIKRPPFPSSSGEILTRFEMPNPEAASVFPTQTPNFGSGAFPIEPIVGAGAFPRGPPAPPPPEFFLFSSLGPALAASFIPEPLPQVPHASGFAHKEKPTFSFFQFS